ncbi:MAG: polymer-forming cytoskeletal protein [Alphaproteobacteria bacterium]|nr:polymer-forming cytoskeletal protein [Alphaproteobacteria bacterium]
MFSKDKAVTECRSSGAPSILSAGMQVTGDIVSDGEVQIDGDLSGDIHCAKLTIGETGRINRSVVADDCLVHGTVVRQIKADAVTLSRSSRVEGDVMHGMLAIEPGARLDGHCRRLDKSETDDPKLDLVVTDVDRGSFEAALIRDAL